MSFFEALSKLGPHAAKPRQMTRTKILRNAGVVMRREFAQTLCLGPVSCGTKGRTVGEQTCYAAPPLRRLRALPVVRRAPAAGPTGCHLLCGSGRVRAMASA